MHGQKTTVNPYLAFQGNCSEAMNFYKEALNGNLEIMTFEGQPVEVPEDHKTKVMHATLTFGDAVIMASDSMPGQPVVFGSSNSISIASPDVEEAQRFFNNLSEGGRVNMPFADTFWGAKFGMLTDQFGINWMINCQVEQPK